jgi:hypothetical protein
MQSCPLRLRVDCGAIRSTLSSLEVSAMSSFAAGMSTFTAPTADVSRGDSSLKSGQVAVVLDCGTLDLKVNTGQTVFSLSGTHVHVFRAANIAATSGANIAIATVAGIRIERDRDGLPLLYRPAQPSPSVSLPAVFFTQVQR